MKLEVKEHIEKKRHGLKTVRLKQIEQQYSMLNTNIKIEIKNTDQLIYFTYFTYIK